MVELLLENDFVLGDADSDVMMIEYGDYHCPFTVEAQDRVEEILQELPSQVCFVFRPLPLLIHPEASLAARAAVAAHLQGRFWDLHEHLFDSSGAFDKERIMNTVRFLGIDPVLFEADLLSTRVGQIVDERINFAQAIGVDEAPTFFVNGRRLNNPPTLAEITRELQTFRKAS